jgi:hypothetical protein
MELDNEKLKDMLFRALFRVYCEKQFNSIFDRELKEFFNQYWDEMDDEDKSLCEEILSMHGLEKE